MSVPASSRANGNRTSKGNGLSCAREAQLGTREKFPTGRGHAGEQTAQGSGGGTQSSRNTDVALDRMPKVGLDDLRSLLQR